MWKVQHRKAGKTRRGGGGSENVEEEKEERGMGQEETGCNARFVLFEAKLISGDKADS